MRADKRLASDRVLLALRSGEMTTPELGARLRSSYIVPIMRELRAAGKVVCVSASRGSEPAVWALVVRREPSE